jgi:uncharacterized protein YegP (UPF0339 family)
MSGVRVFEVYPSPMRIAWHWRLLSGSHVIAQSRHEGYAKRNNMLRSIDELVSILSDVDSVGIIELREPPK